MRPQNRGPVRGPNCSIRQMFWQEWDAYLSWSDSISVPAFLCALIIPLIRSRCSPFTCSIFTRKQSMKSCGELGSRVSWWALVFLATNSLSSEDLLKAICCEPGRRCTMSKKMSKSCRLDAGWRREERRVLLGEEDPGRCS